MARLMHACNALTRNMGDPTWLDPRADLRPDWRRVSEAAKEVLDSLDFAQRTGYIGLVVVLEVNSPFPPNEPVRIRASKKTEYINVKYSVLSKDLPDYSDDAGWQSTLLTYFTDGIERVLKKFKFDTSGVNKIRAMGTTSLGHAPKQMAAVFREDNTADVEIIIPSIFDLEGQKNITIEQYSESLTSVLESERIAQWSAEEVGAEGYSIIFTTENVIETIKAIRQFSQNYRLSEQAYINVIQKGTKTTCPIIVTN